MGSEQLVIILCRLILGAIASFLAIMLWSKTREVAWIFVIIGIIIAYVETVYSILGIFGINGGNIFPEKLIFFISVFLTCLPTLFFIAALIVMVAHKSRRR